MKAKFIGDPNEGAKPSIPEIHEVFGVRFESGKFVDVPDEVAGKIVGNNHFEVQGKVPEVEDAAPTKTTRAKGAKAPKARAAKPAPDAPEATAPTETPDAES